MVLAQLLSWLEHHPVHQNVVGSNPGRGAYRRQPIDVSLCLSLHSPPLKSANSPWVSITKNKTKQNKQLKTKNMSNTDMQPYDIQKQNCKIFFLLRKKNEIK